MILGRPWGFWLRLALLWLADAAYTVSPVDIVPDVIPLLGQGDDLAALLLAALYTVYQLRRTSNASAQGTP